MFILRKIPLFLRYKLKEKLEKKTLHKLAVNLIISIKLSMIQLSEYILKYQADAVIHGHTHRPGYYSVQLADGKIIPRYEIPDWEDNLPVAIFLPRIAK